MGCAVTVLVVLALAVGGLLWLRQSLVDWTNPPAPDVSAVARSTPVDAADQAATGQLDGELARVQALLPSAHPVARGAEDICSSRQDSAGFGARTTWSPVSCQRTVVWFGTVDGPLAATLTRIDASLQHAGMRPVGTAINQLYAIGHAHTPQLNSAYGGYGDGDLTVDVTVDAPPDLRQAISQDQDLLISASPPAGISATVQRAYTPVLEGDLTTRVKPPTYVLGLRISLPYFRQSSATPSAAD